MRARAAGAGQSDGGGFEITCTVTQLQNNTNQFATVKYSYICLDVTKHTDFVEPFVIMIQKFGVIKES